ncbi:unnamed protein product [Cuscuta europaea]|uniref:Glycosyl transferase family 28 C-terminal domain-containing protein n=1 Tax=Cuscuta europaea TaxID=41803 RepID=A0A9P0YV08_CUSEU|nr:unnamed protein product [Cuscuta europaea]
MGEADTDGASKKVVFVTVGTTCFDALVNAVDTPQVKNELFKKGYTDIIVQMGRGNYVPVKSAIENGSPAMDCFTYSSSIAEYLKSASLVISHAVCRFRQHI